MPRYLTELQRAQIQDAMTPLGAERVHNAIIDRIDEILDDMGIELKGDEFIQWFINVELEIGE